MWGGGEAGIAVLEPSSVCCCLSDLGQSTSSLRASVSSASKRGQYVEMLSINR